MTYSINLLYKLYLSIAYVYGLSLSSNMLYIYTYSETINKQQFFQKNVSIANRCIIHC